jgi:hypothetical protein
MQTVTVSLHLRRHWWFSAALYAGGMAIHLGMLKDCPSDEHWSGRVSATERLAAWLVKHALVATAE